MVVTEHLHSTGKQGGAPHPPPHFCSSAPGHPAAPGQVNWTLRLEARYQLPLPIYVGSYPTPQPSTRGALPAPALSLCRGFSLPRVAPGSHSWRSLQAVTPGGSLLVLDRHAWRTYLDGQLVLTPRQRRVNRHLLVQADDLVELGIVNEGIQVVARGALRSQQLVHVEQRTRGRIEAAQRVDDDVEAHFLELVWRAQRRGRRARLHHVADADALRGAPDLAQLVERAWSLHVARVGARVDVQIGPGDCVLQAVLCAHTARVGPCDQEEVCVMDGEPRGGKLAGKLLHRDDALGAQLALALGPVLVLDEAALGTRRDQLFHGTLHVEHVATACVSIRNDV
mmetsp:Transcript_2389/g.6381  ORF Transcript_2389/g.6381 Transcript_2389/m.6381 type:complete len:339 (-) Transcript_2389:602-1618(-)